MRCLVSTFGDAGHVFPALSLSRALLAAGHEVVIETWPQWEQVAADNGIDFRSADGYQVFPPPTDGQASSGQAALALMPLFDEFRPDVVVNDILTVAPILAAEARGVLRATLVPHIFPVTDPGMPLFSIGAVPPRTRLGRRFWETAERLGRRGLEQGRDELNQQRQLLDLPPLARFHGGISPDLAMVATFPQLEYPRQWPPEVHVTGPMHFELPHPPIELPAGDDPLVLIAPSTSQDPDNRLLRRSLEAVADLPVRAVATVNRDHEGPDFDVPDNAVTVEWLSYSQVLPLASAVICHGGHGTVARCLGAGVPVLVCPAAGDMNETAMRITAARAGVSVRWSLVGRRSLRWALTELLTNPVYRVRAGQIATWDRQHDGARTAVGLIESLVEGRAPATP